MLHGMPLHLDLAKMTNEGNDVGNKGQMPMCIFYIDWQLGIAKLLTLIMGDLSIIKPISHSSQYHITFVINTD